MAGAATTSDRTERDLLDIEKGSRHVNGLRCAAGSPPRPSQRELLAQTSVRSSLSAICSRILWAILRDGGGGRRGCLPSHALPVLALVAPKTPDKKRRKFDAGFSLTIVADGALGSPFVQQRRMHPAAADGYRSRAKARRQVQPFFCWSTFRQRLAPRKRVAAEYYAAYDPARALSQYRHHGPHRCR
jgi:hypothetical protein